MKLSVGHAKNEAFELIFGNVLIGLGGFLIGLAYSNLDMFNLIYPAISIFGCGIIFDVRVLTKFTHDLSSIKNEIDHAREELENAKNRIEEVKKEAHADSIKHALMFG